MKKKTCENKIDEIEVEMKHIGLWRNEPLPETAYDFQEAFGADTMTLAEWLQFIFIPRVREVLTSSEPWPNKSQVGIYASQQFLMFKKKEGEENAFYTEGSIDRGEAKLVTLLHEFDDLINSGAC